MNTNADLKGIAIILIITAIFIIGVLYDVLEHFPF